MKMLLIGALAFFALLFGLVCTAIVPIAGTVASFAGAQGGDGGGTVVQIARDIMNGKPEPGWKGGKIPYSWGGGHGNNPPGPSLGICDGTPGHGPGCPAGRTVGLDCSGFVRWVFYLAYGKKDIFPDMMEQLHKTRRVSRYDAQPGDLVFFGSLPVPHHVGIYIGNDQMINAYTTGTYIQINRVSTAPDFIGYYHYPEPLPGQGGMGPYSVMHTPTITAGFINRVLAAYNSPAKGKGQALYNYGVQYGIDPVFALAFFKQESTFGLYGVASHTHGLGNIRCSPGYDCYQTGNHGSFRSYATWEAGFEDWYKLIRDTYVKSWHLTTIDQIIPTYAPASDNNDTAAYIRDVKISVQAWRKEALAEHN